MCRFTARLLLLVLSGAWAHARTRDATGRCRSACIRSVPDARARAVTCARCLTHPDEPATWMEGLAEAPPGEGPGVGSALGRLKASSARHPEKAQRCLAEWVASSAGAERELACQPALHVAGALAQRLVDFLSPAGTGEASAVKACAVLKARLKVALEPSLVSVDAVERREAVRHLSRALGHRPAQVLLEAVAKRPTSFDAPVADGLVALSQDGDEPAGRALLLVAPPANQTHVNRLLAVYAQRRDELRPKLAHPAPEERRAAVSALAALAPLSAPHVSPCLDGPVASVRLAAAKGLARGNPPPRGPSRWR
jgi:hypothetical protein